MPDLKVLQVIPIYFILISENVHILSGTGNTETQTKTGGISHMRGRNFLICGLTGWCMEILFTSAGSLARHDGRLIGQTSLWCSPSTVCCLYRSGLCKNQKAAGTSARQHLYSGYFFIRVLKRFSLKAASFLPLGLQQRQGKCQRLIRLDYAPLWLGAGLLFERILVHANRLT